jgi:protein-disulfide isomerase
MLAFLRIVAAGFALALLATPGSAAMDQMQKQEIETIIHDYLLANPEVLDQAFKALQEKRAQEEAAKQKEAIAKSGELIFNSPHQMVLGNPKGTVTLVEFFDYNCTYCRRAVPDMLALLKANPDLRIVMKEFPILSEGSVEAARISVAIKDTEPSQYLAFHQELFSRPGVANGAKALEVAKDLGVDVDKLKEAAAATEVTGNIKEVHELANTLGISGTPSYIIGTEVVPGALGFDALQE